MIAATKANLGEAILKHYDYYLGTFSECIMFRGREELYPIQLLKYKSVFSDCTTFATMGLSKYDEELGKNCEVVLVTDDDEKASAHILANALFYFIENEVECCRGCFIDGIENISPEFAKKHHKSAIYFTEATCFPNDFSMTECGTKIYMAMFITAEEVGYLKEHGAEAFETYLEEKNIDTFELNR